MTKILWMSDTPFRASGFGLVTREVTKRLADLGHEILILGWWSSGGAATCSGVEVKPCPVNPAAAVSEIISWSARFAPHYLVTLGDIPWLSYLAADEVQEFLVTSGIKWCLYYPVDGTLPDGKLPRDWVRVLLKTDIPVAMSEFGVAASARCGINADIIPHGCDTELFHPPSKKEEAKRRFGYEGRFVVLSDKRNHRRKLIPRALDIIKRLDVPECKLVYHLHTSAEVREDAESYRYDVRADIEMLELRSVTGVHDRSEAGSFSITDLANVYSAADVHLLTSYGEGFGLPTLQAASSGVVPIAPANSANTELVGSHGFAIACDSGTIDEFGIVREFIDRGEAASVLKMLYDDPNLLRERSAAARRFALDFSWDRVAARWDSLLQRCERQTLRGHLHDHPMRTQLTVSPSSSIPAPMGLGAKIGLAPRPTGHDLSILPIPRIGVPTRLQVRREDALAAESPFILAEESYLPLLRGLERLFPGTTVLALADSNTPTPHDVQWQGERAILIIDPDGRFSQLDLKCALCGVNFLGKSQLWPPVNRETLLHQVRLLLTDYALSEGRCLVARQRTSRLQRSNGGIEEWRG